MIIPTLRVTRRQRDAERPERRYHAERGNDRTTQSVGTISTFG